MEGRGDPRMRVCLKELRGPSRMKGPAGYCFEGGHLRVRVCMEEPRLEQLPQRALNADVHKVHDVEAGRRHGLLVRELHPVDPLHAQHAPRCVRPHDAWRPDARHAAVQLLRAWQPNYKTA